MLEPDAPRQFAPIEDLDPEPPGRQAHRRELILALAILIVVVGLAGGNWWDQQRKLTHYQAGGRAAAARDWDRAQGEYAAAGDYADAPRRATDAARQVAERDAQYAVATDAARHDNWLLALLAIRKVAAIQPQYRDTPALQRQAETQAYTAALSGTIALRPQATPPGLYSYTADGWRFLAGSDGGSRVRGTCADGGMLFDTPRTGRARGPGPGITSSLILPAGAGRDLRRAAPDGTPDPAAPVRYNPATYQYTCTPGGLWGILQRQDGGIALNDGQGADYPFWLMYQTAGQRGPVPLRLPDQTWPIRVLAVPPRGEQILITGLTDISPAMLRPGPPPAMARTRFYLADADGSNPRLVDDLAGWPGSTEISPDGRFVLLTMYRPLTGNRGLATTLLLDLTGQMPTRPLAQMPLDLDHQRAAGDAAFIREGPRRGQVLTVGDDLRDTQLRIYDPARRDLDPLVQVPAPPDLSEITRLQAAPDGALLITVADTSYVTGGRTGLLAYLDPQARLTLIHPAPGADLYLSQAWLQPGRLVYELQDSGVDREAHYAVYSLALDQLGDADPVPVQTYSVTIDTQEWNELTTTLTSW
ncbi:MAG TPA: hypothetical protein VF276_07125, partial [Chloroflexia bacterium]